jgi:hypothetical protein
VSINSLVLLNTSQVNNAGRFLTIQGYGFEFLQPELNKVTVCGMRSDILSVSYNSLVFRAPHQYTSISQAPYKILRGSIISDSDGNINQERPFDGTLVTSYDSPASMCFVGYDFGVGNWASLDSISYTVNPRLSESPIRLFRGGVFEGSNDSSIWETVSTIGNEFFAGENIIQLGYTTNSY